MRITRIAKQERRDRCNVFVDGKFFAAFSLDLLAEAGIREGDELAPGQLDPFIARDEAGKVMNKALRFLSQRPHSERELRTKLKRSVDDTELVDEAFVRLRELGYLDDDAFAKQWVEERGTERGPRLLTAELRKKGVAGEIIDAAVASDEAEQVAAARVLAAKRLSRFAGHDERAVRERLTRYLAGRGFGYDIIRQALDGIGTADVTLSD